MAVWALADLHLSFGVPDKSMDVFGENWKDHAAQIKSHWEQLIHPEDLVLLPGDISWALHLKDALADLQWIDQLPGTKVMLRGNHDFWWSSISKIEKVLPPSIHLIQNNAFHWKDISIAGSRLWDTPEYSFGQYIDYIPNPRAKKLTEVSTNTAEAEKIFVRELGRLEESLKAIKNSHLRIAMTHYPPISADLLPSRASSLLEKYNIQICAFGHLHNVRQNTPLFGTQNGIAYHLVAADYVHFTPVKLVS